ncbi:TPA: hypothetical protein DCX16_03255 [bacterium]|nr:hypothetical protein [bacterium]
MEIEGLKCPYCGGNLKVKEIEWADGIVECSCSLWPFLSNILILKKDGSIRKVVSTIEKGKPSKAAFFLLMKESISPFFAWCALHKVSFFATMGFWGYRFWTEYTRFRFSSSSFLSFAPLVSIIKGLEGDILDFGCGTGHIAFFLSKWINVKRMTLCDKNFANLYIAKKFFAKDANFLCIDGNFPLPFPDKIFSTIVLSDSFHFVEAKKTLADELTRILDQSGTIFISHLHNRDKENPISGIPLISSEYIRLFPDMEHKTISDGTMKEGLFSGKISLLESEDVSNVNSFLLILARNPSIFKEYSTEDLLLENLKNPIINPIYKTKEKTTGFIVKRRKLSKLYRKEYSDVEDYIKKDAFIYKRDINARKKELFYKFFLVDAPDGYK